MRNSTGFSITEGIRLLYDSNVVGKNVTYWHYTSLGAILSIFKDYIKQDDDIYVKNCTMWASNVRYMNDPEEYREGVKKYIKMNGNQEQMINDKYCLISFSTESDNLSHWKWYGKNSGVSMCFNINKIETSKCKTPDSNSDNVYDPNNRPLDVCYDDNEQKAYYQKVEDLLNGNAFSENCIAPLFIPFCKDVGYEEEKEARMVFFEDCEKCDYVYNSSDTERIKPSLNIKMRLRVSKKNDVNLLSGIVNTDNIYAKCNENIITKFVVGPGDNQELVFNALIHVFDKKNYKYIEFSSFEDEEKKELENGEFGKLLCDDGKIRLCYRCANGIYIMKSCIPFRG